MKKYIWPGMILIIIFILSCQNKNNKDLKENISVGDKKMNTVSARDKYSLEQIENEADLFYSLNLNYNSIPQIFAIFPQNEITDNAETQNQRIKYCLYKQDKPDNTGYFLSASLNDDILLSQIGGFIDFESYLLPEFQGQDNHLPEELSYFLKDKILLERVFGSYYGCRIIQVKDEFINIITEVPYLTLIIKDRWENKGSVHFISHTGGAQWEAGVRLGIWGKYKSYTISSSDAVIETKHLSKKIIDLILDYRIKQLIKSGEKTALFDLFWFNYQYFRSNLTKEWVDNFSVYIKPSQKAKDIVGLLKKRIELDDDDFYEYFNEIDIMDIMDI